MYYNFKNIKRFFKIFHHFYNNQKYFSSQTAHNILSKAFPGQTKGVRITSFSSSFFGTFCISAEHRWRVVRPRPPPRTAALLGHGSLITPSTPTPKQVPVYKSQNGGKKGEKTVSKIS